MRGGHDKLIHLSAARWSWVVFPPEEDRRTQVLQEEQKQPAPSLSIGPIWVLWSLSELLCVILCGWWYSSNKNLAFECCNDDIFLVLLCDTLRWHVLEVVLTFVLTSSVIDSPKSPSQKVTFLDTICQTRESWQINTTFKVSKRGCNKLVTWFSIDYCNDQHGARPTGSDTISKWHGSLGVGRDLGSSLMKDTDT